MQRYGDRLGLFVHDNNMVLDLRFRNSMWCCHHAGHRLCVLHFTYLITPLEHIIGPRLDPVVRLQELSDAMLTNLSPSQAEQTEQNRRNEAQKVSSCGTIITPRLRA